MELVYLPIRIFSPLLVGLKKMLSFFCMSISSLLISNNNYTELNEK